MVNSLFVVFVTGPFSFLHHFALYCSVEQVLPHPALKFKTISTITLVSLALITTKPLLCYPFKVVLPIIDPQSLSHQTSHSSAKYHRRCHRRPHQSTQKLKREPRSILVARCGPKRSTTTTRTQNHLRREHQAWNRSTRKYPLLK